MIDFNILKKVFDELRFVYIGTLVVVLTGTILFFVASNQTFILAVILAVVGMVFNLTCVMYWQERDGL